ncbi:hypothetical protein [uncultured Alistipes sp.]|jgi:hypothetical protein|uniref:hypothetical protein n=1 Tax=uncultured Alistipes sp. TaxID=538949 RepID=UPI0025CC30BF|nr:hypothetical protein [uncultured Alistipes sp.]
MEKLKRFVDAHVIYCQSYLVEKLISKELLFDDYPFITENEVMEWWLVTSWLAERLSYNGEVVIEDYGCHWWGRQCSGQAVYMDAIISDICQS